MDFGEARQIRKHGANPFISQESFEQEVDLDRVNDINKYHNQSELERVGDVIMSNVTGLAETTVDLPDTISDTFSTLQQASQELYKNGGNILDVVSDKWEENRKTHVFGEAWNMTRDDLRQEQKGYEDSVKENARLTEKANGNNYAEFGTEALMYMVNPLGKRADLALGNFRKIQEAQKAGKKIKAGAHTRALAKDARDNAMKLAAQDAALGIMYNDDPEDVMTNAILSSALGFAGTKIVGRGIQAKDATGNLIDTAKGMSAEDYQAKSAEIQGKVKDTVKAGMDKIKPVTDKMAPVTAKAKTGLKVMQEAASRAAGATADVVSGAAKDAYKANTTMKQRVKINKFARGLKEELDGVETPDIPTPKTTVKKEINRAKYWTGRIAESKQFNRAGAYINEMMTRDVNADMIKPDDIKGSPIGSEIGKQNYDTINRYNGVDEIQAEADAKVANAKQTFAKDIDEDTPNSQAVDIDDLKQNYHRLSDETRTVIENIKKYNPDIKITFGEGVKGTGGQYHYANGTVNINVQALRKKANEMGMRSEAEFSNYVDSVIRHELNHVPTMDKYYENAAEFKPRVDKLYKQIKDKYGHKGKGSYIWEKDPLELMAELSSNPHSYNEVFGKEHIGKIMLRRIQNLINIIRGKGDIVVPDLKKEFDSIIKESYTRTSDKGKMKHTDLNDKTVKGTMNLQSHKNLKQDPGEELPDQVDVAMPKKKRLEETKYDDGGREYAEYYLNNPQGGNIDKQAVLFKNYPLNTATQIMKSLPSFRKAIALKVENSARYNNNEARFKGTNNMTPDEVAQAKTNHEISFLMDASKKLEGDEKLIIDEKIVELKKTAARQKEVSKQDLDNYEHALITENGKVPEPKNMDSYETEVKARWDFANSTDSKGKPMHGQKDKPFMWEKGFASLSDEAKYSQLNSQVTTKLTLNKTDIYRKVEDELTKLTLAGNKNATIDDILALKTYDKNVREIQRYYTRRHDLKQFRDGKLSMEEFAIRESYRLADEYHVSRAENLTPEELNRFTADRDFAYSRIGLHKETRVNPVVSSGKAKQVKPADMQAYEGIRQAKLKAYEAYRKDGTIIRKRGNMHTNGGGRPILNSSEMRDIDEFGNYLIRESDDLAFKYKAILDKNVIDPRLDTNKAIKKAQDYAKRMIAHRSKNRYNLNEKVEPQKAVAISKRIDAKNSMAQIIAVTLGDSKLFDNAYIGPKNLEFRQAIADKFAKKYKQPITKDEIKTIFMIKGYGSTDKGLAARVMEENPWLRTEEDAIRFINDTVEEFADASPMFKAYQDAVAQIHKNSTNGEYKYTMPDGFEVSFSTKANTSVRINDGKFDTFAKVSTDMKDPYSVTLLPRIIHSIDGYINREMRKRLGMNSAHDSFTFNSIVSSKKGKKVYADILNEIREGDLMNNIVKQLDDKVEIEGASTLSKAEFNKGKDNLLETEINPGDVMEVKRPKTTANKQMTDTEIMRQRMAEYSSRNHEYHKMIDAMVDEAVITDFDIAKARTNDDVYERMLAYALQGEDFSKVKLVEPKNGENITKWNEVQEGIFHEFRAKVEFNPSLKPKGKRQFFKRDGSIIHNSMKSTKEFRIEAEENFKNINGHKMVEDTIEETVEALEESLSTTKYLPVPYKDLRPAIVKETTKVFEDVKQGKGWRQSYDDMYNKFEKAFRGSKYQEAWNHIKTALHNIYTKAEEMAKEFAEKYIDKQTRGDIKRAWRKSQVAITRNWRDVSSHIKAKWQDDAVYQQYTRLAGMTTNLRKEAKQRGSYMRDFINENFTKQEQEDYLKHFWETDASTIYGINTKSEADAFVKANRDLMDIAGDAITDTARGMGVREHQYGGYMINAENIVKNFGIDPNRLQDVDKLITIQALNQNNSWKWYEANVGTSKFDTMTDLAVSQHQRARAHFKSADDVMNYHKGYIQEFYDRGKTINENGRVEYDTATRRESGVFGNDKMHNVLGTIEQTFDEPIPMDIKGQIALARRKGLRLKDGKFYQVADAKKRDEAGRVKDLAEMLGQTETSISTKGAQQYAKKQLLNNLKKYDGLISKEKKEGFVRIKKSDKTAIDSDIAGMYIKKEYYEKLVGRVEVGRQTKFMQNNKTAQTIDRVATSLVTRFKQNVVLKNVSSFKNAVLINLTNGLMMGQNPMQMKKYYMSAYDDIRAYQKLRKAYDTSVIKGDRVKAAEQFRALQDNDFHKMLDAGLSVNTADGVVGNSDIISHFTSNVTGNNATADMIANNVLLNQRGTLGQASLDAFSMIDSMGRYASVKHKLRRNIPIEKAVAESNDLYGQMDEVAPHMIQFIDKYGIGVFAKWGASVVPSTAKLAYDNPKKALALTAGLMVLSDITGTNLTSANPVEGAMDFTESTATLDGEVWSEPRKWSSFVVPNVWKDIAGEVRESNSDWYEYNTLFKARQEPRFYGGEEHDYRSTLQKGYDYLGELNDN